MQYSKRLQYRAHEAADEAALSQCAAHMRPIRCVSKCLKRELWPLPPISCCVLYLPGQSPTCRRRYGDHQQRENSTITKDAEKDVARAKPKGQRKSSSTANSDVILPKIVNRWQIRRHMALLCWSDLILSAYVDLCINTCCIIALETILPNQMCVVIVLHILQVLLHLQL